MKKSVFLGLTTGVATIAATVCITVSSVNNTSEMSDLMTKNLEALSQGEGGSVGNYNLCYSKSKVKQGATYYDCGSCKKVYDEEARGTVSKCFF